MHQSLLADQALVHLLQFLVAHQSLMVRQSITVHQSLRANQLSCTLIAYSTSIADGTPPALSSRNRVVGSVRSTTDETTPEGRVCYKCVHVKDLAAAEKVCTGKFHKIFYPLL